MPVAAWITLLAVALIVGVVGISLVKVIFQLKHVAWTLGAVIVGVNAIAYQTRTIPEALSSVNANLAPVRNMAEQVSKTVSLLRTRALSGFASESDRRSRRCTSLRAAIRNAARSLPRVTRTP